MSTHEAIWAVKIGCGGRSRLFTEASITARPFFEAQGFVVLTPQVVTVRGVEFVNYRMERIIAETSAAADRGRM